MGVTAPALRRKRRLVVEDPTPQEVERITSNIIASASASGEVVQEGHIHDYSWKLARTLKTLQPEQMERVFGTSSP